MFKMCIVENFSFNRDLTISHANRSSQGVLICNQGDFKLKMECGIEIRIETKIKGKCVAGLCTYFVSK